jgi:hypothetical protein
VCPKVGQTSAWGFSPARACSKPPSGLLSASMNSVGEKPNQAPGPGVTHGSGVSAPSSCNSTDLYDWLALREFRRRHAAHMSSPPRRKASSLHVNSAYGR